MSETSEKKGGLPGGPKKWTTEDKLRVLVDAHGLTGEALGALLRREGLHEAQLMTWRDAAAEALGAGECQHRCRMSVITPSGGSPCRVA